MKYWEAQGIRDRISEITARQHQINWDSKEIVSRTLTEEEEGERSALYRKLEALNTLSAKELESDFFMKGSCGKLLPVLTYERWLEEREMKEKKLA